MKKYLALEEIYECCNHNDKYFIKQDMKKVVNIGDILELGKEGYLINNRCVPLYVKTQEVKEYTPTITIDNYKEHHKLFIDSDTDLDEEIMDVTIDEGYIPIENKSQWIKDVDEDIGTEYEITDLKDGYFTTWINVCTPREYNDAIRIFYKNNGINYKDVE